MGLNSFQHCVTKVLWSFFPVSRMIRTFTTSGTKVTEWHSRRLLGSQARGVQTETIFCYVLPLQLHGFFFFLSFLSVQIPSEYFTLLAVQIYSFGFLSRLIMSGPDLLGGYRDSLETQWLTSWEAQERWTPQAHVGHMGVAFWNRVKQKGLWEEGFAVFGGWGSPWFLSKDVIGFFESTRNLTRKHYTAILSGNASGAFNMEVCCYRTLSGGAEQGQKLESRPFKALSNIPHVNSVQNIIFSHHLTTGRSLLTHTNAHTHKHRGQYTWLRRAQSLDMDGPTLGWQFPNPHDRGTVSYHSNTGTRARGLHLNCTSPPSSPIPLGTGQ